MIYLKQFESVVDSINKSKDFEKRLKEFCGYHLSYLKDKGFVYEISTSDSWFNRQFKLTIEKIGENGSKEWVYLSEYEDEIIQFLEFLKESFDIVSSSNEVSFYETSHNGFGYVVDTYTIDDIVNMSGNFRSEIIQLRKSKICKIEVNKIIDK